MVATEEWQSRRLQNSAYGCDRTQNVAKRLQPKRPESACTVDKVFQLARAAARLEFCNLQTPEMQVAGNAATKYVPPRILKGQGSES